MSGLQIISQINLSDEAKKVVENLANKIRFLTDEKTELEKPAKISCTYSKAKRLKKSR